MANNYQDESPRQMGVPYCIRLLYFFSDVALLLSKAEYSFRKANLLEPNPESGVSSKWNVNLRIHECILHNIFKLLTEPMKVQGPSYKIAYLLTIWLGLIIN